MTSQEDNELARWIMDNVKPGTDWLWTPRVARNRLVAMRIHGFQGTGSGMTEKYDIEISFFLVKQRDGWHKVGASPSDKDSLPRWFLAAMGKPEMSSHTPDHIWSDAFKALVDSHQLKPTNVIRYTVSG